MGRIHQIEEAVLRSRRLPALVIALALAVLAGVVALSTLLVRARIRDQMAGRDGEVLYAVALQHYAEDLGEGLAGPISLPGEQLSVVLKSAQLRGVLGVRLFDVRGQFVESFPLYVTEQGLSQEVAAQLASLRPLSRFHPRAEMAALFYPDESAPSGTIPLLEVLVPLHREGGSLAGIAQFLVEGHSLKAEYARLDRNLARQAGAAFLAGGLILGGALFWAFRRLQRAQRLLAERTENLLMANQELALAARTSALGAVAAHLIHGLKNPLAGLQNFVVTRGTAPVATEVADWDEAVASTRRMQGMIQQVIGVLREEQSATRYEVTLAEIVEGLRRRVEPLARERGLIWTASLRTQDGLPNRAANLVTLILVNLVENAIQATPSGKQVTLEAQQVTGRLVFEVRDEGGGFPAGTPLFAPCRSTREGGSGIGLALCKQLANHLGADLELTRSTPEGCVFRLSLPFPRAEPNPDSAA